MKNIVIDARSVEKRQAGIGHWLQSVLKQALKEGENCNFTLIVNEAFHASFLAQFQNCSLYPVQTGLQSHPANEFYEVTTLPKILKELKADIYISSPFRVPPCSLPCPVIAVIYDLAPFYAPESMPLKFRLYIAFSIKGAMKRAERIITISETVKEEIVQKFQFKAEHIFVVPPAADARFLKPVTEQACKRVRKAHLKIPHKFFLFVGTIEPRKNIGFLLDALEISSTSVPLLIVGKEGWKSEKTMKRMTGLEEKGKVIRTGYIADEELPALYHLSEAFCFPSTYEGFGIPLLEADALRKPVFCSDIPVFREINGESERFQFFALDDPKKLAKLLDKPPEVSQGGRLLQDVYSWEKSGKLFLQSFNL